jgi:hypothetical protein
MPITEDPITRLGIITSLCLLRDTTYAECRPLHTYLRRQHPTKSCPTTAPHLHSCKRRHCSVSDASVAEVQHLQGLSNAASGQRTQAGIAHVPVLRQVELLQLLQLSKLQACTVCEADAAAAASAVLLIREVELLKTARCTRAGSQASKFFDVTCLGEILTCKPHGYFNNTTLFDNHYAASHTQVHPHTLTFSHR